MLFILSGASGVGKSTLCNILLARFPEMELSVSVTTRSPRGAEVDGVHYHFVARGDFESRVSAGRFVEWAEVHGNLYGTSRDVVDAALARGRTVLFDIDYQGAESLLRLYGPRAVATMVVPPSMEALEERLRGRGTDDEAVVARRMAKAREEMGHAPSFDHVIVNDALDSAVEQLAAVYIAARCRSAIVWPQIGGRYT